MTSHVRAVVFAWALVAALAVADVASGQTRWNSGQNVQPVFEGWKRNPDGMFSMVFGYLNRNYQEQPHVPVGSHNYFEPGDVDRRQPTHFYNRRQSFVFEVQVPADWDDKDLIWTVTHNGRTDKAYGSLWPVWEIDEAVLRANRGMGVGGAYVDNNPPTIQIASGETDTTVTLPEAATLTALAGDDGIPGPDPEAAERRRGRRGRPGPSTQNMVNPRAAVAEGIAVTCFIVTWPVGDASTGGPSRRLAPQFWQLLHPLRLAGRRVERFDEADAVRGVQHAADHERCRAEVVGVLQVREPGVE